MKTWKKLTLVSLILVCCTQTSCRNVYTNFANTTNDAALLYAAQMQIDSRNFDAAIATIQSMSAGGQADRDVQSSLASAYAGSCGLDFLTLAQALSGLASQKLFQVLLLQMKSGTRTNITACKTAESILLGLSSRTVDESLLLALTEFVKIGRILAVDADPSGTGTAPAGFDSCATTPISDTDARDIGTGLTIAVTSIASSGITALNGATGPITSVCATIDAYLAALGGGFAGYSGFCNKTSGASFTSTEVKVFRSLTRSNEIGLGTCTSTFDSCLCSPFP